jgi:hypothetical protein
VTNPGGREHTFEAGVFDTGVTNSGFFFFIPASSSFSFLPLLSRVLFARIPACFQILLWRIYFSLQQGKVSRKDGVEISFVIAFNLPQVYTIVSSGVHLACLSGLRET